MRSGRNHPPYAFRQNFCDELEHTSASLGAVLCKRERVVGLKTAHEKGSCGRWDGAEYVVDAVYVPGLGKNSEGVHALRVSKDGLLY